MAPPTDDGGPPLKMVIDSYYIPEEGHIAATHPFYDCGGAATHFFCKCGEDAHFFCEFTQVIGIADGVSLWRSRGVDAGIFARELMKNASNIATASTSTAPPGFINTKGVIKMALLDTLAKNIPGTATACVMWFDGRFLQVASLGDTGCVVVRRGKAWWSSRKLMLTFDLPFNIGMKSKCSPQDAVEEVVELERGDIVIAGTDGLFDNMFTRRMEEVVANCLTMRVAPRQMAAKLAAMAHQNSRDKGKGTPYAVEAEKAGFESSGGKRNDITAVVAYVIDQDY